MFNFDVVKSILEAILAHYHIHVILTYDVVFDVIYFVVKGRTIEAIKVLRQELSGQTKQMTLKPCLSAIRIVSAYVKEVK